MTFSLPPLGISLVRSLSDRLSDCDVRECAAAMVKNGLRDAGYEYVIIPDTWCREKRCYKTDSLVCDSEKFPEGLAATADYVHSLGLKLGVAVTLGARSATNRPGIFDHEWADVAYYDAAGVDYISCDLTNLPSLSGIQTPVRRMGMAIRKAERKIYFALYTSEDTHLWMRSAGVNSYCLRSFADAAGAAELKAETAGYSADFCFESCGDIVWSDTESLKTQLVCASIMSSPIIADCDVRRLSDKELAILKNPLITGICRDEEARPARLLGDGVYCKFLTDCEYAVAFVNNTDETVRRSFFTYDFGLTWNAGYYCEVSDIFTDGVTDFSDALEAELPAGASRMYLMRLIER